MGVVVVDAEGGRAVSFNREAHRTAKGLRTEFLALIGHDLRETPSSAPRRR